MKNWLKDIDFFFNRHGYSLGQENPENYLTIGDFGIPLSLAARSQVEACGDFYDANFRDNPPRGKVIVLSTPYLRGVQTFDIYRPRIRSIDIGEPIFRDYLGEHRYGVFNGRTDKQLLEEFPDFFRQRQLATEKGERHLWAAPGIDVDGVQGESQFQLCLRTRRLIEDASQAYADGVRTIIVNAHGSSMRAAEMNILGIESSDAIWKQWRKPQNCQIDLIRGGERFAAIYPGSPEPQRPFAPRSSDDKLISLAGGAR